MWSDGLLILIGRLYGSDMTPSSLEMAICVRRPESVAFGMLSGVTVVVLRMCIMFILLTAC